MITKISETVYTTEGYTIHVTNKNTKDYYLEQNKGELQRNQIPSLKDLIEISEFFGFSIIGNNSNLELLTYEINNQSNITINHNRNRKVICQVYDQNNEEIFCEKKQIDNNNINLKFNPAFTGFAIIL